MSRLMYGGLEIDEDMKWQRGAWTVQRIGWVTGALVLIAALAGFCGPGYFSRQDAASQDLQVSYNRFVRYLTPANLEIRVPVEEGEAQLWLDTKYLGEMSVENVTPEPESVESDNDRQTYTFSAIEGAREVVVVFEFQPEHIGQAKGRAGVPDGPEVSFSQFVYP